MHHNLAALKKITTAIWRTPHKTRVLFPNLEKPASGPPCLIHHRLNYWCLALPTHKPHQYLVVSPHPPNHSSHSVRSLGATPHKPLQYILRPRHTLPTTQLVWTRALTTAAAAPTSGDTPAPINSKLFQNLVKKSWNHKPTYYAFTHHIIFKPTMVGEMASGTGSMTYIKLNFKWKILEEDPQGDKGTIELSDFVTEAPKNSAAALAKAIKSVQLKIERGEWRQKLVNTPNKAAQEERTFTSRIMFSATPYPIEHMEGLHHMLVDAVREWVDFYLLKELD